MVHDDVVRARFRQLRRKLRRPAAEAGVLVRVQPCLDLCAECCGSALSQAQLLFIRPYCPLRGLAMDPADRAQRHLDGLLPARRAGLQVEVDRAWAAISRCTTPLQKYEARGAAVLHLAWLLGVSCRSLLHRMLLLSLRRRTAAGLAAGSMVPIDCTASVPPVRLLTAGLYPD